MKIDHIVYGVPDLDLAIEDLGERLGVNPTFGGRHLDKGTKNAIVNLGDQCYLEILAIDHDNEKVTGPRWMGIDFCESPKVLRWAYKTIEIEKVAGHLAMYKTELGKMEQGSRHKENGDELSWIMTKPGSQPEVEVVPFFVDWSNSQAHPTDGMEKKCVLSSIELYHIEPDEIRPLFSDLELNFEITKADRDAIFVYIESPRGIIRL